MRRFTALSAGLLVSVLGSALTSLALAVWVFRGTQSATLYGLSLILQFLPGILFAPLAGALVDRWNRRLILIVSGALQAASVACLAPLAAAGVLELWHVFTVISIQSMLRAIQVPAMSSVVVLLAPKEHIARANGMVLLANAVGNMVGFAAGGVLLLAVGLMGVLLIDCATFVLNIAILFFVPIPDPPKSAAERSKRAGWLLGETREGWRYLSTRRVLVAVILFYAALNFSVGYVDALLTPLVLSFASAAVLGLVIAAAAVGMVLGGVALTTWGGPRRRIHGLAGLALPLAFFLYLGAVRPNVVLIMVAALGFTLCFTIIDGTTRSVLQLEVEPGMQGRAFATFTMVANAGMCAAYALAGPVADHYAEPFLRADGPLAGTVGALIGVGPGRGMAFLVLLAGLVVLATAILAYLRPGLRDLPDRPTGAKAEEVEPAAIAAPALPAEAPVHV
jgi:DHA3 family macrolide efflux protein-like MFS transporter